MIRGVQKVRSLTRIVKKVPLAIYLKGTCLVISLNVVFSVWLQARWPKGFSQIDRYPGGVTQYTQDTWELKSVVVLSNAQSFIRGLHIYN